MAQIANEINWLRNKVDANPASIFFARLADQYLALEEVDRAIDIAERGLVTNPHYATAHYILAKCYVKRQEFDRASKYLKDALSTDPDHLAALSLYGELLNKIGSTQEARKNYQHILTIDPGDHQVQSLLKDMGAEQRNEQPLDIEPEPSFSESDLDIQESDLPDWPETEDSFLSDSDDTFEEDTLTQNEAADFGQDPFEEFTFDVEQDQEPFDIQQEVEQSDESEPLPTEEESPRLGEFDDFEMGKRYEEQGQEFNRILDDIFSDSLSEEERKEEDTRSTIENIAKSTDEAKDESSQDRTALNDNLQADEEQDIFADNDEGFEPLLPREDTFSPEEQILNTAQLDDDLGAPLSQPEFGEDEEESLPEEFISFEDDDFTNPSFPQDQYFIKENAQSKEPEQTEPQSDAFFEPEVPKQTPEDFEQILQQDIDSDFNEPGDEVQSDFKEPEDNDFDQLFDDGNENDFQDEQNEPNPAVNDEEYRRFISSLDIQEDESVNPEKQHFEPEQQTAQSSEQELDEVFGSIDDFDDSDAVDNLFGSLEGEDDLFTDGSNTEPTTENTGDDSFDDEDSIFSDLDMESGEELNWDFPEGETIEENESENPTESIDESPAFQENPKTSAKDKFVTPTLGEIYAAQGQYSKAISVFETLLKKNPENQWYQKKLDYLQQKLKEQNS